MGTVEDIRQGLQRNRLRWGLALVLGLWLARVVPAWAFPHWLSPFDIHETLPFALLLAGWFGLLSVGLIGGGVVWLTGTSWRDLGWRREGLAKAIGLGLVGFALSSVAMSVLRVASGSALPPELIAPGPARILLVAFFAFGIAAWVEENLFRGYLQPLLATRLSLGTAIVIQAAVFTLAHLGYVAGVLQLVWVFLSGLIFGWLRGRDRSLVAPYVAHGLGWMMTAFGPPAF